MTAIFVHTPFQLINALNLVKIQQEECVLFICFVEKNSAKIAEEFYFECKNDNVIKDVYFFDRTKQFSRGILQRLYMKLKYGGFSVVKSYISELNLKYRFDKVVLPKWETYIGIFAGLFTEDVSYYILEDGIGDYIYSDEDDAAGIKGNDFLCAHKERIKGRYFTMPEMFTENSSVPKLQLPELKDKEALNILYKMFDCDASKDVFGRYIYFAQMFDALPLPENGPDMEQKIFKVISDELSKEELTVKLHPRATTNYYGVDTVISLTPWELLTTCIDDIEDRVLISMCSGSLFYPKILCGKEPYVICLLKLYADYVYSDSEADQAEKKKTIAFIESVGERYKNKEKFFIPSSFDELKEVLKKVKEG